MSLVNKLFGIFRKSKRDQVSSAQRNYRQLRRRSLFIEGLENRKVLAAGDLLISEFMANPSGTDSNREYVELIATRPINFATTPYSVIWTQNGGATTNGWKAGFAISYGFNISSGSVNAGDVFYVGGVNMDPTGTKLRTIDVTTQFSGDGGLGTSAPVNGNLGNGGLDADSIAVFDMAIASVTDLTVPIDAIFYGSGATPGTAVVSAGADGYQLPDNDRYSLGYLQTTSFLAINPVEGSATIATGSYAPLDDLYPDQRDWTNGTATSTSAIILTPTVTDHPDDSSITYGSNTTFTATASGSPTPGIQWQISVDAGMNWSPLSNDTLYSGVTSNTLTLIKPTVALSDNMYRAHFTIGGGSADSDGATLTVAQKALTATGAADSKVYDGNANAAVTITLNEVVAGDEANVTGSATGTFNDKHVDDAKPVTISTINLVGSAAANYTVGAAPATSADITIKSITVTAAASSRAWSIGSTASSGVPTISPSLASGDSPNFGQTYNNPDVGTNKTLTPLGNVTDGNNGNNYLVEFASANTGTITATMAAPTFTGSINNGVLFANSTVDQRSQIVSLKVNLTGGNANAFTFDPGAFSIVNTGLYTVTAPVAVSQLNYAQNGTYNVATGTSFVITFGTNVGTNGSVSGGVVKRAGGINGLSNGNSLADGTFKLIIDRTKVHQIDGQTFADNEFGELYSDKFYRMFGDNDGDGDVDGTDTVRFRAALTAYNPAYDWDGGGTVTNGSSDSTNYATNNSKKRRLFA